MIEEISGMPAGTIGLKASGSISADDYRTVIEPALQSAVERGEPIKLLFVMGEDAGHTAGAAMQNMKTSAMFGVPHRSSWRKTALASDSDGVKRAANAFGWMMPGEFRTFSAKDIDEAKSWLAA